MNRLATLLAACALAFAPLAASAQAITPPTGSNLATPVSPANGGSGVANTGNLTWTGALTFTDTTGQTFALPAASDTLAGLTTAQTFTKANTFSVAGTASTPALSVPGAPFLGTATTSTPQLYLNNGATPPTSWSTSGTFLGVNAPSGWNGNFLDFHTNGGASLFSVNPAGAVVTASAVVATGNVTGAGLISNSGTLQLGGSGVFLFASGSGIWRFGGNDAAAPVAQTFGVQNVITGTSNTAGVSTTVKGSLSTGSGLSGDIIFQTGGTGGAATIQNTATTALTIKGATQAIQMPALASSSAAQTGTVCWTTGTGNLTIDTTTTCLLSDMRLKKNMVPLNDNEGLREVMALKPFSYDLKDDPMHAGRQVGFGAQEVAKVDPRLVAIYDRGPNAGTPKGVRYEQLTAVLVKAIQQEQAEIKGLQREVRQLRSAK